MRGFSQEFDENVDLVKRTLRVNESFDLLTKKIRLGGRRAVFFCVDGFIKDVMFEKILEYFSQLTEKQMKAAPDAETFLDTYITYIECSTESSLDSFVTFVLSGAVGMLVEGYDKALILDPRSYPSREMQEPDSDRLLRGAHEGFLETVIYNTALIRRHIRDPLLTFKHYQIGSESKTDVVVCYLEGTVDRKRLQALTTRLQAIRVRALAMGQESLRECLLPAQPWNPFPRFRYTERPDTASACIYDGNIIVLTDGSPSAMIVPTGIFDYIQDINDFYFPPVLGTFFRFVRCIVFSMSLVFIPTWYVLQLHRGIVPDWIQFIFVGEPNGVSIFLQLIVAEFVIDTLKLASMNTPSALSNSFAVVGALVLGEFGVSSGIFVPEVVLFMAFSAISNFTQNSYELGFAIKLCRMTTLVLTFLFDFWGYFAAVFLILLVICTTKTIDGYTYLYPLIPFNGRALAGLLYRRRLKSAQDQRRNDDLSMGN